MQESQPIVSVKDLHKNFGALRAVDGVSFKIQRGEVFGLLGPNGAGKTTTISMISGIMPPASGEVRVGSEAGAATSKEVRRSIGVVPQDLAIYFKLTGRENLRFFGSLYGLAGATLEARVNDLLEMVGLSERADDISGNYSGGMKRRLNLAVGLVHGPQLLLLDEPTVGVDPQSRNHIFEGVKELNRQGLTVLYTSHYMEEVQALCDRVGIMDHGKLVACDTIDNLLKLPGGSLIVVETPPSSALDALKQALLCIESVHGVEIPEPDPVDDAANVRIQIRTDAPARALPAIVATVARFDIPLLALNLREPNLEDVFLQLTGTRLRD